MPRIQDIPDPDTVTPEEDPLDSPASPATLMRAKSEFKSFFRRQGEAEEDEDEDEPLMQETVAGMAPVPKLQRMQQAQQAAFDGVRAPQRRAYTVAQLQALHAELEELEEAQRVADLEAEEYAKKKRRSGRHSKSSIARRLRETNRLQHLQRIRDEESQRAARIDEFNAAMRDQAERQIGRIVALGPTVGSVPTSPSSCTERPLPSGTFLPDEHAALPPRRPGHAPPGLPHLMERCGSPDLGAARTPAVTPVAGSVPEMTGGPPRVLPPIHGEGHVSSVEMRREVNVMRELLDDLLPHVTRPDRRAEVAAAAAAALDAQSLGKLTPLSRTPQASISISSTPAMSPGGSHTGAAQPASWAVPKVLSALRVKQLLSKLPEHTVQRAEERARRLSGEEKVRELEEHRRVVGAVDADDCVQDGAWLGPDSEANQRAEAERHALADKQPHRVGTVRFDDTSGADMSGDLSVSQLLSNSLHAMRREQEALARMAQQDKARAALEKERDKTRTLKARLRLLIQEDTEHETELAEERARREEEERNRPYKPTRRHRPKPETPPPPPVPLEETPAYKQRRHDAAVTIQAQQRRRAACSVAEKRRAERSIIKAAAIQDDVAHLERREAAQSAAAAAAPVEERLARALADQADAEQQWQDRPHSAARGEAAGRAGAAVLALLEEQEREAHQLVAAARASNVQLRRRCRAAVLIQATARMWVQRSRFTVTLTESRSVAAATTLHTRRDDAASTLALFLRLITARRAAQRRRSILQRFATARGHTGPDRLQCAAATLLQTSWRGVATRRAVGSTRALRERRCVATRRHEAARAIQAALRGHQCRQKLRVADQSPPASLIGTVSRLQPQSSAGLYQQSSLHPQSSRSTIR